MNGIAFDFRTAKAVTQVFDIHAQLNDANILSNDKNELLNEAHSLLNQKEKQLKDTKQDKFELYRQSMRNEKELEETKLKLASAVNASLHLAKYKEQELDDAKKQLNEANRLNEETKKVHEDAGRKLKEATMAKLEMYEQSKKELETKLKLASADDRIASLQSELDDVKCKLNEATMDQQSEKNQDKLGISAIYLWVFFFLIVVSYWLVNTFGGMGDSVDAMECADDDRMPADTLMVSIYQQIFAFVRRVLYSEPKFPSREE